MSCLTYVLDFKESLLEYKTVLKTECATNVWLTIYHYSFLAHRGCHFQSYEYLPLNLILCRSL